MKKLFALTLAVLMVVSMFPLAAIIGNAATLTSNVATVVYQKDGVETELGTYDTLDAAFEALHTLYEGPIADTTIVDGDDADSNVSNELYVAAGSPVIKLNGDFTGALAVPNWITGELNSSNAHVGYCSTCKYNKDRVVNIVVDGNNHTISCGAITMFDLLAFYNLTVKNTKFTFTSANDDHNFRWNGNRFSAWTPGESFTVFENCTIDQNSTLSAGSDQGGLFKMNGKAKAWQDLDSDKNAEATDTYNDTVKGDIFNLTFKDTTVTAASAVGLQVHWGADANIKLLNSTFTIDGVTGAKNNYEVIKFYEAGAIDFYMDGTSKLVSARSQGSTVSALIRDLSNMGQPVTYTFEEGAQFILDNEAAMTNKAHFVINASIGKVTVNDKGAIWKASAIDVKSGVKVPTIRESDGSLRSFKVGADTLAGGATYTDANATAAVNFIPVYANPVCVVGPQTNVGYKNINDAFTWVYNQSNSEDYTIYLYGDVSTSKSMYPTSYDCNNVKTIRVDGNGHTLTSTASGRDTGIFYGIGLYNLKLSDIKLVSSAEEGLNWSPRLSGSDSYNNYVATGSNPVVDTYAEFTNVTYTPANGVAGGTLKFKGGVGGIKNTGVFHVKMTDCNFTSTKADTMFMMNNGAKLDLTLIGTTLNFEGGAY